MQRRRIIYENKRRDRRGIFFLFLLFFLLFPYIISNFSSAEKQSLQRQEIPGEIWIMQKKAWGYEKIPLEEYLEGMLAATIPWEYHKETIKAQAVILRTFCISRVEKKDGRKVIRDDEIKELYLSPGECDKLWKEDKENIRNKIRQALEETKGLIVVYEGKTPSLPFVRISNGVTRDLSEYFIEKESFYYMKSVPCPEDEMAEDYIQYVEMSTEEFQKKIQTLSGEEKEPGKVTICRDATDYVKEVFVGDKKIEGEIFRSTLGLVSSCFTIEKIDNIIQIQTKGMGHGFGFSQFSANKMAEKGEDFKSLLQYFFQNITIEKIK